MVQHDPAQLAFSHYLISGTLVHEAEFTELQQRFGVFVHPRVVVVVSIDRYPDLTLQNSAHWPLDIGQKLIDVVYACVDLPFTWIWTEAGVLALLVETQEATGSKPGAGGPLLVMARKIQTAMQKLGISVSIGIGGYHAAPEDLHLSFQEAIRAMHGRFFQGNQLIFQHGANAALSEVPAQELAAEKAELVALLCIGDEQGVTTRMQALLDRMAEACHYNEDVFKGQVLDLITMMSRSVLDMRVSAARILSKNAEFTHELYSTIRYDKFVRKVMDYAVWLTRQVGETTTPDVSPVIRDAIQFMKQHHREDITLVDVARHCCMSKYYLSHLFKKEVGMGVIEYLNSIRVEKAAFYVQTTDLPIQQIATLVGFDDANYFSRLFRRYMNCSPTVYRAAR
ncbi:MAG: AraC family transcriptional regulator [Alicyclobacillus shizuokensis]|nr:AraC family transcriptional regulator [Alicyclobacillus shizuokensis]